MTPQEWRRALAWAIVHANGKDAWQLEVYAVIGRLAMAPRAARKLRAGQRRGQQGVQIDGHVVERAQKGVFQRKRAKGKGFNVADAGGLLSPANAARRIERIAALLARQPVHFHHGDVAGGIPEGDLSDCIVILDPPYQGATSYAADCPRWRVLALAEELRSRGAWVLICEAVPLPLPGWYHVELTRPGGKPEWVTCSRAPVWMPRQQQVLFAARVAA